MRNGSLATNETLAFPCRRQESFKGKGLEQSLLKIILVRSLLNIFVGKNYIAISFYM